MSTMNKSELEKAWGKTAAPKTLTVRQLMSALQKADPNMEVTVFANGDRYPLLITQIWREEGQRTVFEIGCGWAELDEFHFKI